MMRIAIALSTAVFVSACMEAPEPSANKADRSKLPSPIVMVGDAAAGAIAAKELRGDGLSVATDFNGRAAGITTFCSGNADAMALTPGQDLTSAERKRCKELGGGWSALSTRKDIGLYVWHGFATELIKKAKSSFLG